MKNFKKILSVLLLVGLVVNPLAFAVEVSSNGTKLGQVYKFDFTSGFTLTKAGGLITISGAVAAITSGTIAGVTINSSAIGGVTPAAGAFTTVVAATTVTATAGDFIATDGRLVMGTETGGTCSSGLVIDLAVSAKGVLTTIGETNTACAISFTNGVAGDFIILTHDYNGTGVITFADVTGFDASWTPVVNTCTGIDAAVTAANNDHFYIIGAMASATELTIAGCQYFDAA